MKLKKHKIYLAGPEVFHKHQEQIFENMIAICKKFQLIGMPPSDGGLKKGNDLPTNLLGKKIYKENIQLIHDCDAVIANLDSFRGGEPDSGTVFEVGYAFAIGKIVVGYESTGKTYGERVEDLFGAEEDENGDLRDKYQNCLIEQFNLKMNLMLGESFPIVNSFQAAVELAYKLLNGAIYEEGIEEENFEDLRR